MFVNLDSKYNLYFTVCIILLHVKTELKLHTIMFTCFHGWMYNHVYCMYTSAINTVP